jgi:multidrug resistance efflux pump
MSVASEPEAGGDGARREVVEAPGRRGRESLARWLLVDLVLLLALGGAGASVVAVANASATQVTSQSAVVAMAGLPVAAPVAGTVVGAPVRAGGRVARGASLFTIRTAGSSRVVRAAAAGTLSSILVPVGSTVSAGETLGVVLPTGAMEVVAMVSESSIRRVHPGQLAHTRLAADPGILVRGRVLAIWPLSAQTYIGRSGMPAPPAQEFLRQTALVPVAISLDRQPRGLASGESAEVTIDVSGG